MAQNGPDRCTFKDLCIDVDDPATMAAFWAAALGLRVELLDTGAYRLVDGVAEHVIWINRVPDQRSVKQRVHLDVNVADVAELEKIGAGPLAEEPRWTVLADPEGGELCAFVRPSDQLGRYRLLEVVVDAADPEAIATWWGERLGADPKASDDRSFWWLEPTSGLPAEWVFQAVPEPKRVKNRIHWDVLGDSAGLVSAGARMLRGRGSGLDWDLLADPEGNEFCVFSPR
jgi:hypothetical protein